MTVATALLHLESELAPSADLPAFRDWCDHHHEEILRVPGFLRARRFELVAPEGPGTRVLTLYDLADAAVLDGEAYATHGRTHTPLPAALVNGLTFARSVWSAVAPDGAEALFPVGAALVAERSDAAAAPGAGWPPLAADAPVVGLRRFAPLDAPDGSRALTLVEIRSAGDVAAVLRALPPITAGSRRAAYRQVFHERA